LPRGPAGRDAHAVHPRPVGNGRPPGGEAHQRAVSRRWWPRRDIAHRLLGQHEPQAKGPSALDRAKESSEAVVAKPSPDDRVTLVRVTGRPEEVFSRSSTELSDLQDRIDGLQTSPSRANLFGALVGVFGDEQRRPANPLVYFFTDAQAGSFREIERQKAPPQ